MTDTFLKPNVQQFVLTQFDEADFEQGDRPWVRERNLGFESATSGMVGIKHYRISGQHNKPGLVFHRHRVELQIQYVLKGWVTMEFEGQPPFTAHAGSAWLQPPGILHRVIDYSDDMESLEINVPASFETEGWTKPEE